MYGCKGIGGGYKSGFQGVWQSSTVEAAVNIKSFSLKNVYKEERISKKNKNREIEERGSLRQITQG